MLGDKTGLPLDKWALHWLGVMIKLGPINSDGSPKGWSEIYAFALATGRAELGPDLELLRDMCHAYATGLNIGCDVFGIAPSKGAEIERRR